MKLFSLTLPYILLVTFYTGPLNDFGTRKLEALDGSPYEGVAVPLVKAYDTKRYKYEDFKGAVAKLKGADGTAVWPWVFFNRFVGYEEGGRAGSPESKHVYFSSIRGMDLYDEWGALGDFYDLWKTSLRIARDLGSPGIVADPETYNNYDAYKVSYVAEKTGKTKEEVKERLREIGRELGRIADETYPGATIWFLFTGLGNPMKTLNPFDEDDYRTVTYIIEGMLSHAAKNESALTVVSGGEVSLGYCSRSLGGLKSKVASRRKSFAKSLAAYPNLKLGGTIAPWNDSGARTGWMRTGDCGSSELKTAGDFKPLIKQLAASYGYVWIYAAKAAGYNPYRRGEAGAWNKEVAGKDK